MEQSKLGSLIESLVNLTIGFVSSIVSQIIVFPLLGIHIPLSTNFEVGVYFTLISLVRTYVLRRWFNARLHRATQALANKVQHD